MLSTGRSRKAERVGDSRSGVPDNDSDRTPRYSEHPAMGERRHARVAGLAASAPESGWATRLL